MPEGVVTLPGFSQQRPGYQSPFSGFNPINYFGGHSKYKAGNLPPFMQNWGGPAKYALGPTQQFGQQISPMLDFWKGEMGSDISGNLMEKFKLQQDQGMREGERMGKQALTRAGVGGQGASPYEAFQTQLRMMAGMGQMGLAAQTAEMMARQYRGQAANSLYNLYSGLYQANLTPAQFQAARSARVPISGGGPGFLEGAQGFLGGFMGGGGY